MRNCARCLKSKPAPPLSRRSLPRYSPPGICWRGLMAKVNEIRVESWKELMEALYHNDWAEELQRHRSPFVYRGLVDSSFTLSTSLNRHAAGYLEGHLLRNFKKSSQLTSPPMSDWLWLALAQHHGLPTR